MKTETYTPSDIADARWLIESAKTLRHGEAVLKWAAKVVRWWNGFRALLRRYAKALKDSQLAMSAIWQNIRAGFSTWRMLRDISRKARPPAKYAKTRVPRDADGTPHVTPIAPRTNKHTFRMRNMRIADTLQSRVKL